MTSTDAPIVIIGGGLSGLISATLIGRAGLPVTVLEKTAAVGGRATTREKNGYFFNLGPHALYRRGVLRQTLGQLGVETTGAIPGANGGFAIRNGRTHTLPVGLTSLLTTGLLSVPAKFELARLLTRLKSVDANAVQRETLAAWLDSHVDDLAVRQLIEMLVRVTTFTNDPGHQSAGAALEQLQLSLNGSVLYLDRGWQTIVDGLARAAADAGARITSGASAAALEERDERSVDAVRLADGSVIRASAIIMCTAPGDVESLTGVADLAKRTSPPVRVATLDVGLRALPKPRRTVAFGLDDPLYFSVHSAVARLAPEGAAVVHATKYLRPDETAGRDVERELDRLMDMMQPGWRDHVEFKQFLPNLVVNHSELTAARGGAAGRPSPAIDAFDNVFVAGDWVGARGQLSDAAAGSAVEASRLAVAAATRRRPSSQTRASARSSTHLAAAM